MPNTLSYNISLGFDSYNDCLTSHFPLRFHQICDFAFMVVFIFILYMGCSNLNLVSLLKLKKIVFQVFNSFKRPLFIAVSPAIFMGLVRN